MIVDAHGHACGRYLTVASLERVLDSAGCEKVVLVPGELRSTKTYRLPPLGQMFPRRNVAAITNRLTRVAVAASGANKHIDEGNHYVHTLVQQAPTRIIQFYWVCLSDPDSYRETVRHYREWKFKGVKLHQCWETFRIGSSRFRAIAAFASSNGLPVFIHLWSRRDVEDLIEFSVRNPDCRIIVAHLFGLEQFIDSALGLANVYFEMSSPRLISDFRLGRALKHFGAKKIILRSDEPYGVDNLRTGIGRIQALDMPRRDKDLVLGGNIVSMLALDRV